MRRISAGDILKGATTTGRMGVITVLALDGEHPYQTISYKYSEVDGRGVAHSYGESKTALWDFIAEYEDYELNPCIPKSKVVLDAYNMAMDLAINIKMSESFKVEDILGLATFLPKGIELNGVANIHLMLDMMAPNEPMDVLEYKNKIKEQLDLLERYMIEYSKNPDIKWHEIKANKSKFKLNNGKV